MNNVALAKGMLLAMKSLGVIVDKWNDTSEGTDLYISVPKASTDKGQLAGKQLADRLMTRFRDMGASDIKVKFRIRDEVWTKEKSEAIMNTAIHYS